MMKNGYVALLPVPHGIEYVMFQPVHHLWTVSQ